MQKDLPDITARHSSVHLRPGGTAFHRGTRRFTLLWLAFMSILGYSLPGITAELPVAADWSLTSGDGISIRLSDVADEQTTVLFFWATWCPYCKALMPHLQSMRLEYGDDVRILAISIFEDGEPVAFINDAGYDFTVLLNGDDIAKAYGITGTPGVLIVNGDRKVHFDLRRVSPPPRPTTNEASSNRQKAAYLAPYWASEIRKGIDSLAAVK